MERCMHGLPNKECCAVCNGQDRKIQEKRKEIKQLRSQAKEMTLKYNRLQLLTMENAKRHKEDFNDDELKLIVENTVDKERRDLDNMFNIAYAVERTMNSIDWIWKCAWDKKYNALAHMENLYYRIEAIKQELGY